MENRDYPSIWMSPQIEIAWPEMVRPRGLHRKTIASASCRGVTVVRIEVRASAPACAAVNRWR